MMTDANRNAVASRFWVHSLVSKLAQLGLRYCIYKIAKNTQTTKRKRRTEWIVLQEKWDVSSAGLVLFVPQRNWTDSFTRRNSNIGGLHDSN